MDRFRSTDSHQDSNPVPTDPARFDDCDQALEVFSASLDGEASLEELDALTVHLLDCESCRAAVAALEEQDEWLRDAGPLEKDPLLESPQRRKAGRGRGWRFGRVAAAAAALAAGIAVALLVIPWQGAVEPERDAGATPGGEGSPLAEVSPRQVPEEGPLGSAQGSAGGEASELSGEEIPDQELDLLMAQADAVVAALPRSSNRLPEMRRWGGGEWSRDALSAAREMQRTLPAGPGSVGERLFEGSSPTRSMRPRLRERWSSGSDEATKNPFRRQRWTSRPS